MTRHTASFRDPLGYIFYFQGKVYRHITHQAQADYDQFMTSGLYAALTKQGLLIPHKEVKDPRGKNLGAYKVILPEQLEFITYPYEWSFSHYQDAALLTARVQKIALEHDMTLKDASAYNVQLHKGRQVFIDTLSFARLTKNHWEGYKQFCEHFVAPLLLMTYTDLRMSVLMRDFIDGVPLSMASKLLPSRAKARPGVFTHIIAHNAAQQRYAGNQKTATQHRPGKLNKQQLLALVDNLERLVKSLKISAKTSSEWHKYYEFTNYSDTSFKQKQRFVREFAGHIRPDVLVDVGGNDGTFVREAHKNLPVFSIAADIDPLAVEEGYGKMKRLGEQSFVPVRIDLTNPSAGIGWGNEERTAFADRIPGKKRLILALALIHHLSISNNVPFEQVAQYFVSLGEYLVIEFVPKGDSKVDILLANRDDVFLEYTQKDFEAAFSQWYKIMKTQKLSGTKRTLYLMQKKG